MSKPPHRGKKVKIILDFISTGVEDNSLFKGVNTRLCFKYDDNSQLAFILIKIFY